MKSFYRLAIGVCIALIMVVGLWSSVKASPSPKSSSLESSSLKSSSLKSNSLNESRIRQLEFQVRSLQTQISQIQSRSPRASGAPPITSPPAEVFNEPSSLEQFDNLATLVIEINQRLIALEQQLAN